MQDAIYLRRALALEYSKIMGVEEAMRKHAQNVCESFRIQVNKLIPILGGDKPFSAAEVEEMLKPVYDSIPQFIEESALISAEVYTEEELRALIDFYKGPLGSSILKKSNEATAKVQQLAEAWTVGLQSKLESKFLT